MLLKVILRNSLDDAHSSLGELFAELQCSAQLGATCRPLQQGCSF